MNSVNGPHSDRNSLRYVGQAKADHVGRSRAREKLLCERMIVYAWVVDTYIQSIRPITHINLGKKQIFINESLNHLLNRFI